MELVLKSHSRSYRLLTQLGTEWSPDGLSGEEKNLEYFWRESKLGRLVR
jgi:hypothetical protein